MLSQETIHTHYNWKIPHYRWKMQNKYIDLVCYLCSTEAAARAGQQAKVCKELDGDINFLIIICCSAYSAFVLKNLHWKISKFTNLEISSILWTKATLWWKGLKKFPNGNYHACSMKMFPCVSLCTSQNETKLSSFSVWVPTRFLSMLLCLLHATVCKKKLHGTQNEWVWQSQVFTEIHVNSIGFNHFCQWEPVRNNYI